MVKSFALVLLFFPFTLWAGYTVTWTAPTENTDGTPLSPGDIDAYQIFCAEAYNPDGTPTAYDPPVIQPGDSVSYVVDWADPGDYKCKIRTVRTDGVVSPDSREVFFALVDLDGDGNGEVSESIILEPGAPSLEVACSCPANSFTVTRSGYYTITGPDGSLLLKADGTTRQVTTRDEAYQWITADGRKGQFIINQPQYRVEWQ